MLKLSCGAVLSSAIFSSNSVSAVKKKPHSLIKLDSDRLSWRAYRGTDFEGELSHIAIEGELPHDLSGRLLRLGPGQKMNHKTRLNHFFDGDAYIVDIHFSNGEAFGKARFVNTPEREKELRSGRMLFNEFGTKSPKRTRKLKKQANVNLIPWGEHLLTLNEGSSPCLINRDTFEFIKFEDFNGVLPSNVSFAGHPKFDPQTGKGYSFGIEQGIRKSLYIFEFDSKRQTLKVLYRLPQKKLFLVHDMLMSENLLAFYLPPVYFNITDIVLNRGAIGESLTYDESHGGQLLVVPKNGQGKPSYIPMPKKVVFHHGNAYEKNGQMHFVSFATEGMGLIDYISKWNERSEKAFPMPRMTKYVVDLQEKKLISEKVLVENHDFPHFNEKLSGHDNEILFALEGGDARDPVSFPALSKVNIESGERKRLAAGVNETFGEAILANSYLLTQGYSGDRDESFIDVILPDSMKKQCRVWLGRHVPLGFHGHFLES